MRQADSSLRRTASWLGALPRKLPLCRKIIHDTSPLTPQYVAQTRLYSQYWGVHQRSCFSCLKTAAQPASETLCFINRLDIVEKKKIMSVRNTVLRSGMVRNQLKPAIRTKHRGLSSSGDVLATWRPSAHWPSHRETEPGYKILGATSSSIFTRFGTQRFSSLLAPGRHSTWTLLLIGCEDKGGGAAVAGTDTKRSLLPEKFMPEWNVGGDLWKTAQTSLKISLTVNHFKHDLSSFHLNDHCIISKSVTDTDNVSFCFVFLHKFCWKRISYRQIFSDFRVTDRSRKEYWLVSVRTVCYNVRL
jgi:hypothetical protein